MASEDESGNEGEGDGAQPENDNEAAKANTKSVQACDTAVQNLITERSFQ